MKTPEDYHEEAGEFREKIWAASRDYTDRMGRRPVYLYLGHDDFKTACVLPLHMEDTQNGLTLEGLEVLTVPRPSHFNVG